MIRQRLLLDLVFIGGVLALAAGLAATPPTPPPRAIAVADDHHPSYATAIGGMMRP